MTCQTCNTEIADTAKFCPNCGAKAEQEPICSSCSTKLSPGIKFCPNCGTPVQSAARAVPSAAPGNTAEQAKQAKEKGDRYREKNDWTRAIAEYTEAIRLKPDYVEAFAGRAMAYTENGNTDDAQKDLKQAFLLDPNNAAAFLARAAVYAVEEDFDQALVNINKSIQLDPNSAEAFGWRGAIYLRQEQYDSAIKNFNKSLELESDNAALLNLRGITYAFQEQYDLAMEDANKAIKLDPTVPDYYKNRGVAHYMREDYDDAVADYIKISQLDPDYYPENNLPFLADLVNMGYTLPFEPEEQETEIVAQIKCGKCGEFFIVSEAEELESGHTSYTCNKCQTTIDVSFFGVCSKCENIVGFTATSLKGILLDWAQKGVESFLNPVKSITSGLSLIKKITDDVVSASGRGICPICGQDTFQCPNCGASVAIPVGIIDTLVVACENCGTRIRQG